MPGGAQHVAKWQHAWISVDPTNRDDRTKLETMGDQGWELVSVQPMFEGQTLTSMQQPFGTAYEATLVPHGTTRFLMFFKRLKEE